MLKNGKKAARPLSQERGKNESKDGITRQGEGACTMFHFGGEKQAPEKIRIAFFVSKAGTQRENSVEGKEGRLHDDAGRKI